jgi:membrane protease YdiL (CAAX protease family)
LIEALLAGAAVTGVVALVSLVVPPRYVATVVGFVFLGATYLLVWRKDDATVVRSGLSLGGLVLPTPVSGTGIARDALRAFAWALAAALVTFGPFWIGFRYVWRVRGPFAMALPPSELAEAALAQLVLVALPEEAFYRGYMQSRLDEAFSKRISVLGAPVGLSLVLTSVVFAVGHVATIPSPARLAVFFPSLAFGWLRARTGGIGAACVFHAICNVYSELLGRGYGLY